MNKKVISTVSVVLLVVATGLIVQKKLRVDRPTNRIPGQSGSSRFNAPEKSTHPDTVGHVVPDSAVDKAQTSNGKSSVDHDFDKMVQEHVLKATSDMRDELRRQGRAGYQERWYRETYLATKQRLKNTYIPQTVHGKIGFQQLYESLNEPAVIVAKLQSSGGAEQQASCSMIVDGAYSLGRLKPGTYEVYLNETSRTPGIWVHSLEIRKDQASLPINFELGTACVSVSVLDERGNPVESDDVELLIGGTAEDIHTWKKAKGLKQGLWQVDYLYKGQYFLKAVWDGNTVGQLCHLADGQNEVRLSFGKRAKQP